MSSQTTVDTPRADHFGRRLKAVPVSTFECQTQRARDAGTLLMRGQIDVAAVGPMIVAGGRLLGDPRVSVMRIDCAEVVFFDCAALGAVLELDAQAQARGKVMFLRNVPPCVSRVLALTRTESSLAVVD